MLALSGSTTEFARGTYFRPANRTASSLKPRSASSSVHRSPSGFRGSVVASSREEAFRVVRPWVFLQVWQSDADIAKESPGLDLIAIEAVDEAHQHRRTAVASVILLQLGKTNGPLLQPCVPRRIAVVISVKLLHAVGSLNREHEQTARKRAFLQSQFDDRRQTVVDLPELDRRRRQRDLHSSREALHASPRSAARAFSNEGLSRPAITSICLPRR